MTGPLFSELERSVSDYTKEVYTTLAAVLKENGQLSARIAQLEAQLATCQADRDRAREAREQLAGASMNLISTFDTDLEIPFSQLEIEQATEAIYQLQAALAAWRGETGEPEGEG